ncbi:MAG TPA: radical SAM protein [Methanothrix sp.]|nr:radical SAM protein [Methanothrix sp.]
MIVFGPVPSRRLGRSLGINNIPPKVCTYSCAYCQVGRTSQMETQRRPYYPAKEIFDEVKEKVEKSRELGMAIDYLTFVPDGEPTLDINLGREIDMLRSLGIRIAVISNASLIWDEEVQKELCKADWVSLKVDAVEETAWHKINRPHRSLELKTILHGVRDFSRIYGGTLVTETMLLRGINDGEHALEMIADFLSDVSPTAAYISMPTRPPAEEWARLPSEESINRAYQIFNSRLEHVELLVGYEGDSFASTGDAEQDLLGIMAVHPLREDAVKGFLERAGKEWILIQRLMASGQIAETEYGGKKFYSRPPAVTLR